MMPAPKLVTYEGFLFDMYPVPHGCAVWLIDSRGNKNRLLLPFFPFFYVKIPRGGEQRISAARKSHSLPVKYAEEVKRDLFTGKEQRVMKVTILDPERYQQIVRLFAKHFPPNAFFTSDLLPSQQAMFEHDLFPLGLCHVEHDKQGIIHTIRMLTKRDDVEYELPPLVTMVMRYAGDFLPAKYLRHYEIEIEYDGITRVLERLEPEHLLHEINRHLRRCDPDIILTEYGDASLLPKLEELSRRYRIPLELNRDQTQGYTRGKASSFVQYGQVLHKEGHFELAGRWHIDADNSFTVEESALDGLIELARVTRMPPQRQARASIGTGLSSLQLSWAYRKGYLIPAKKKEPEEFKPASTLLMSDRGGLIYQPPIGYHEKIAELDFVSMYPSIMVNHNVSPETVNCRCCSPLEAHLVPELNYWICGKREGLVPATLRMVIQKRAYYKKMRKKWKSKNQALATQYDKRQNALKWMLVSCFGYLGYKNARFGRIEAHESVNAYSRDAILTAKEIAEENGFSILHAIVDCVWIRKQGATEKDFAALARKIATEFGIDVTVEGIYKWILFPPSKVRDGVPTANHYVGVYTNGELKMRGIEARRKDTPRFIKRLQQELLDEMAKADSVAELRNMIPRLLEIAEHSISILLSGNAPPLELAMKRRLSRDPEEYTNNSVSAVVASMIRHSGVPLSAGEQVQFIIIDQSGKKAPEKAKPLSLYALEDGYDREKYTDMALKAVETLLGPLGWDLLRLKERLTPSPKKEAQIAPIALATRKDKKKKGADAGQPRLFEDF